MTVSVGHRRGFTLAELSVVLLLLGLTMAVVSVSFRSPTDSATLETFVRRIANLDRLARIEARRNGSSKLVIDTAQRIVTVDRSLPQTEMIATYSFPNAVRASLPYDGLTPSTTTRIMAEYDRHGHSRNITVEAQAATGQTRWLLIAGGSGQVSTFETRETFDAFVRAGQSAIGHDSH